MGNVAARAYQQGHLNDLSLGSHYHKRESIFINCLGSSLFFPPLIGSGGNHGKIERAEHVIHIIILHPTAYIDVSHIRYIKVNCLFF